MSPILSDIVIVPRRGSTRKVSGAMDVPTIESFSMGRSEMRKRSLRGLGVRQNHIFSFLRFARNSIPARLVRTVLNAKMFKTCLVRESADHQVVLVIEIEFFAEGIVFQ